MFGNFEDAWLALVRLLAIRQVWSRPNSHQREGIVWQPYKHCSTDIVVRFKV